MPPWISHKMQTDREGGMTFVKQIAGAAILLGCSLSAPPARAAYIVDLTQVGSNVVATGSGTIDTAGLSFFQTGTFTAQIIPEEGLIVTGPLTASTDKYMGSPDRPVSAAGEGVRHQGPVAVAEIWPASTAARVSCLCQPATSQAPP